MHSHTAIAKPYAHALFAAGQQDIQSIQHSLNTLKGAYAASVELSTALKSPLVPATQKANVLKALTSNAPVVFGKFIDLLCANSRAEVLPAVADIFQNLVNQSAQTVVAQVNSTDALTTEIKTALQAALKEKYPHARAITFNEKIDPTLLGGLTVQVGATLMDASVRGRLNALKTELLK
jgi:F-type H+-transporting ATPase subunit delta